MPVRFHSYNINGDYLATIPMVNPSFGSQLNGQGAFSGTVMMSDPQVQALNPIAYTRPGACILVADLNGNPLEAYFVTSRVRHNGPDGPQLQLTGASLWWWLTKRVQATDYSNPPHRPYGWGGSTGLVGPVMPYWTQVAAEGADLIAVQIITDALQYSLFGTDASTFETNFGLPVGTMLGAYNILGGIPIWANGAPPHPGFTPTVYTPGMQSIIPQRFWVQPTFPYSSLATLDSVLQSLTTLGFDVGIDVTFPVYYTGASIGSPNPFGPRALNAAINITYPQAGQLGASSTLMIDLTRARQYDLTEDATSQGIIMYETGVTGTLAAYENVGPLTGVPPWPLLEQVNSFSGMLGPDQLTGGGSGAGPTVTSMLEQLAASESYAGSYPVFSGTVRVPLLGADPPFGGAVAGGFGIGDTAIMYLPPGVDFVFPNGINQLMRIVAWQANLPSEGDQTVDITLNVPPNAGKVQGPALNP